MAGVFLLLLFGVYLVRLPGIMNKVYMRCMLIYRVSSLQFHHRTTRIGDVLKKELFHQPAQNIAKHNLHISKLPTSLGYKYSNFASIQTVPVEEGRFPIELTYANRNFSLFTISV